MGIPQDLQARFGRRELVCSLRTSEYPTASLRCATIVKGSTIVKDSKYWVPLIALYSGARLQEICQLYVDDIYQHQGVWILDINDNGEDKSLKNQSSRRKVPIHPKLTKLGLLDFVKKQKDKQEQRLFPDISLSVDGTYSGTFSKQFGYMLRTTLNIKDNKVAFHSFRHGFTDALRTVDTPDSVLKSIIGHGEKGATANYGSAEHLERMKSYIQQINFPTVKL